jgi:two-component system cell cycle response regulator DivK
MAGEPILIIDDNPINLKLEKILLVVEGYDVRTATDAEEALKVMETFVPRLVLMDLQLPGMSGLELTQKIKSNPRLKNTIILAVTAYAMKGDKEKALEAGCDGYITKPIDTKTMPTMIANYLGSRASA